MGVAFDVSFQWRNLSPGDVRAHGGEGVLVYSGNARPSDEWCQAMRDAGLHVVWIWETDVDAALRGYEYGREQCRWHESRIPAGELTYVAACDLNNGALAGRDVTAFLRGWADTTREPVFGQYGSEHAIQQGMTVGGKLQRFWGVAPWLDAGGPNNHPRNLERWRAMGVHLIQLVGEDIPGTDTNETVRPDWWSIGEGDEVNMDDDKFRGLVYEAVSAKLDGFILPGIGHVPGAVPFGYTTWSEAFIDTNTKVRAIHAAVSDPKKLAQAIAANLDVDIAPEAIESAVEKGVRAVFADAAQP